MLSISHAFSTFNADACDARHILSLREDRNRILGSPLDTLHHSLVETGYQATKHGSIYPTESGRLLVVHHGQARGYDWFMVNRIVPPDSRDSAYTMGKHTVTFYFLPFRSRQRSASISTGISVVSIHH